jgi:hypothetical protein
MHRSHTFNGALTLLLLAGCSNPAEIGTSQPTIRVANATLGMISVSVDGRPWVTGLSMNGLSLRLDVPRGDHRIRIDRPGMASTELTVAATLEARRTLVAYPGASGSTSEIAVAVLDDTITYVSLGKSKLRIANLAGSSDAIEIRRREPDSSPEGLITMPLPFKGASRYYASDPGVWEVWVSAPGSAAKTVSTGPIEIPGGEQRTVLLLDSPVGPRFVVVPD